MRVLCAAADRKTSHQWLFHILPFIYILFFKHYIYKYIQNNI